jgi:hypothetical protein
MASTHYYHVSATSAVTSFTLEDASSLSTSLMESFIEEQKSQNTAVLVQQALIMEARKSMVDLMKLGQAEQTMHKVEQAAHNARTDEKNASKLHAFTMMHARTTEQATHRTHNPRGSPRQHRAHRAHRHSQTNDRSTTSSPQTTHTAMDT